MRSVVLRFTSVYPSLNKILRMNRWKRNGLKKEYWRAVGAEIAAQRPEPFQGRVKIELDVLIKSTVPVRRDADNYQPKWLLDALVRTGVITDDNSEVIVGTVDIKFITGEQRNGIDLRITEVE